MEQLTLSVDDPEVCKEVKSHTTNIKSRERTTLHEGVFKRFSSRSSLRRAITALIVKVRLFKWRNIADKAPQQETKQHLTPVLTQATKVIVKAVQHEGFKEELSAITCMTPQSSGGRSGIKERKRNLKKSHLYQLDRYIDDAGIVRVGGRLHQSNLSSKEKHPVILPKNHHVSKLLLRFYHEEVHHQGHQIIHGALQNASYWLISGHAAVAKLIGSCVTCKQLCGAMLEQQMADLPPDRIEAAPFTNVGFDVFGQWAVQTS